MFCAHFSLCSQLIPEPVNWLAILNAQSSTQVYFTYFRASMSNRNGLHRILLLLLKHHLKNTLQNHLKKDADLLTCDFHKIFNFNPQMPTLAYFFK